MKKIIPLFLALLMLSCNKKNESEKVSKIDSAIIKLPDSAYVSENKSFLDAFKNVDSAVIVFSPPSELRQPMRKAVWLKDDYVKLYPKLMNIGNPKKPEIYAVKKFKIDKNFTGLVTQNLGEYYLSSINLMLYDHKTERINSFIELADRTDDTHFSNYKKTVLVKDSGKISGLMRYTESLTPVDADDPSKPYQATKYFSVKIKNGKIDSAKATNAEIARYKGYFK